MRLAELLWAEAVTDVGDALGRVHDVRLRLAQPPDGEPALVVEGVIVGVGALSARLGYATGDVAGPWILAAVARRLGRSARYVAWSRVVSFDDGVLRVRGPADDLPHPGSHGGGRD